MVPPSPLSWSPAPLTAPLPPPREPGTPYRVCLVCLGNICLRLPMAETVLGAALAEAGLAEAVTVDSSGTGDWHVGEPMYPGARRSLARRGYDGSAHRARQFEASWLLANGTWYWPWTRAIWPPCGWWPAPEDRDRIRLFGEVGGLGEVGGGEIPDLLHGGTEADFAYVLDLLWRRRAGHRGPAGQAARPPLDDPA